VQRSINLILPFSALLLIWEWVGRNGWIGQGALPAPSQIISRYIIDWAEYPPHILATIHAALLGFLIGNAIAILAGVVFALFPTVANIFGGVNLAIFALPPIAIVPILVLMLPGIWPRVVLAAIGCYFPTMTNTVLGLRGADVGTIDLVRAYGGGKWKQLKFVRLQSAFPFILSGLKVGAPSAVLGSILGEFGGGSRWGLGAYLLGSLGKSDPARLWGIGLTATLVAGVAYFLFDAFAHRMTSVLRSGNLPTSASVGEPPQSRFGRFWVQVSAVFLPFLLWWAAVHLLPVPELIAKSPIAVLHYLFGSPQSQEARGQLASALMETVPIALFGLICGLCCAFLLAAFSILIPQLFRVLLPFALVTQTMPLVALTPLVILVFGRTTVMTLVITVSVTFFPAFATMAQGLASVSKSALDLARAYGATWWKAMYLITVPAALPHLFAAARLAVSRALLGVMIAEWLATGLGLGNLLNESRGMLDYDMIWTVAVVTVMLSAGFYFIVSIVERSVLKKMG
jgi:sulfonate transport system permease protein